jgi:magnesium chelatase subunit I
MQARKRRVFPFTAIVGQEEMKLALLLNVIDPRIGGVMIMGDRGTGKSTTIRALADLLPEIDVVAGDPYNSSPADPDSCPPRSVRCRWWTCPWAPPKTASAAPSTLKRP